MGWIVYTPLFQQVPRVYRSQTSPVTSVPGCSHRPQLCMLVASPLALIVALWGMSGVRVIEQQMAEQKKPSTSLSMSIL